MSQKKYAAPLQVKLHVALSYTLYIYAIHLLALVALLLPLSLPLWLRVCCVMLLVASCVCALRSSRRHYQGVLSQQPDGKWACLTAATKKQLHFKAGYILNRHLIVMRFKDERGRVLSWCFFPDSLDAQQFRQLRIFLRYSASDAASATV